MINSKENMKKNEKNIFVFVDDGGGTLCMVREFVTSFDESM